MKVAIVILNWNGVGMLRKYLPSVLKSIPSYAEVVVADNASTDDSISFLKSDYPDIRIVQLDKNYGFAGGYNRALQQIEAEYYLLLNSDVRPAERWLEPLVLFMDSHKDVAACQPKILSVDDPSSFEYAGACGGFIDKFGYPFCRGRLFDTVEKDEGQYDDVAEIMWATGACLLIRSEDYWQCNGFDERFFAHNEEIDLCWRLRLNGRKIFCIPQSKVYHVGGGTLPKNNPWKTFLNFRNNLVMLYKNLSDDDVKHVLSVRCVLDYVAAIKMLLADRNFSDFKAVVKARREFKHWRRDYIPIRKQIQENRKVNNTSLLCDFPILWKYYVQGRRTYKSLFDVKNNTDNSKK